MKHEPKFNPLDGPDEALRVDLKNMGLLEEAERVEAEMAAELRAILDGSMPPREIEPFVEGFRPWFPRALYLGVIMRHGTKNRGELIKGFRALRSEFRDPKTRKRMDAFIRRIEHMMRSA